MDVLDSVLRAHYTAVNEYLETLDISEDSEDYYQAMSLSGFIEDVLGEVEA